MTFCYLENVSEASILIKSKEARIPLPPKAKVSIDANTHKLLEDEIRIYTRAGDIKMTFPDAMFKDAKPAKKVELKEVKKDSTPVQLEEEALDVEKEEEHIKMKETEEVKKPKVAKKKASVKKEAKVTLK